MTLIEPEAWRRAAYDTAKAGQFRYVGQEAKAILQRLA